ncbi:hypothetical protein ACFFRR_008933 [Megaselia abdita]
MKFATLSMESLNRRRKHLFLIANKKFNSGINYKSQFDEISNEERYLRLGLAKNFSGIPLVNITDDTLQRQIDLFHEVQLIGLEDNDYESVKSQLKVLKDLGRTPIVCDYNAEDCNAAVVPLVPHIPKINDVITLSKNLEEVSYYWTNWRSSQSNLIRENYFNFLYSMRQAASYNGHVSPSRTWYLYFEDEHLMLKEFEHAIRQIKPLYRQLHALIRHQLIKRFSVQDPNICSDGHIPDHLMDKVIAHAWKAKGCLMPPYPDRKLPDVKEKMDADVFNPPKINEIASQFFETMGIEPFTSDFWLHYARKITDEEIKDECKAEIYNFPPEVALKYCPKADFKKFLQMHGHMAELHYNLKKKRLPFGLDKESCPGFSSAIGEAAIISAGSPRYLEKVHLIQNYTLDSQLSMNRLFRLGVHTLFTVNRYFVYEKILVDSMDHRVKPSELNCAYWKYQDHYAGVSPPDQRNEKTFDPGYRFFSLLDPEKPNTVRLVSEIMGYQIYRALCIKAGQYKKGDPDFPLHNCDFSGSKEAGDILNKAMELGSTKNWRDVLELLTGERKINGQAIVEFYKPLENWLKDQNRQLKNHVGWDSSEMCAKEE